MTMGRRAVLAGGAALLATRASGQVGAGADRGGAPAPMPDVRALAETLARRPHQSPAMPLHPPFANLTYDSFRGIRQRPGGAGGRPAGGPFVADLMPPGLFFRDRVRLFEVADGLARELPFSPDLFTFDPRYFGASPPKMARGDAAEMGFSGLRLRGPLNAPDRLDELIVFQGASYFRALAQDSVYGLSARVLAIGTGGPAPEEFPVLTRFWLHRAAPGDTSISVEALLESPSCTGALALRLVPGAPTRCEIDLHVFPRRDIADIGIAPLTSMFWFGAQGRFGAHDFRPAVHDSDRLWALNGAGESLVRPLANPARLQMTALADNGPRAFGLLQSPRAFRDFEDAEAAYHRRPSAWVEPVGDWGPGAVTLAEIPTADEYHDNIVAFWRPSAPLRAGRGHRFAYRLIWADAARPPDAAPGWRVIQSRAGRDPDDADQAIHVIDFAPSEPVGDAGGRAPHPELSASTGAATAVTLTPLPGPDGALRAGFRFRPGAADLAELRLVLRDAAGAALSDVWLYRWTRARDGGV
jgi:glucans biosynthesis protein